MSDPPAPSSKSQVWDHFSRSDNNTSKCNICGGQLKNGSTTTPLWNHLRFVHGKDSQMALFLSNHDPATQTSRKRSYEDESSIDDPDTRSSSSSPNLEPTRKRARQPRGYLSTSERPCSPARTELITQAIAKMVATDMLPFSHVQGEGFRNLMSILEPSYKTPCPKTIVSRIHLLYKERKEVVKEHLWKADWVAIDCDSWTSLAMNPYTTINAHFIDSNWKKQTCTLSTKDSGERHTSENLRKDLENTTQDFGISKEKICGCTTDNATNASNAADDFVEEGTRCAAHTIQLCVREGLKIPLVKEALDKNASLVAHFKHSSVATAALRARQELFYEKEERVQLAQRCPTRFDSDYHMCNTTNRNKSAINAVLGDRSVTKLSVAKKFEWTNSEWVLLEDIEKVLKPLAVSTRILCSNRTPTLSMVRPIVRSLIDNHLDTCSEDSEPLKSLKSTICEALKRRFKICNGESSIEVSLAQLASAVDPRYKSLSHEEAKDRGKIWSELEVQLLSCDVQQEGNETTPTTQETLSSSFEKDIEFIFKRHTAPQERTVAQELEAFQNCPEAGDPLQWWKANESLFPRISQLAKKYLCIPGTSVQSERNFSIAGNIVSAKRTCLDPENVDELIFLYQNRNFPCV